MMFYYFQHKYDRTIDKTLNEYMFDKKRTAQLFENYICDNALDYYYYRHYYYYPYKHKSNPIFRTFR